MKYLTILLLLAISVKLSSDVDKSYSFINSVVVADYVGLVKITCSYLHGYSAEVLVTYKGKEDSSLMFWQGSDIDDRKRIECNVGDTILVSLELLREDREYDSGFIYFIEKKGNYTTSFVYSGSLDYKNGYVFGQITKDFGCLVNEKNEEIFVPYIEEKMRFEDFEKLLKLTLGKDLNKK